MVNILIVDDEIQNIDVIKERIGLIDEISHWNVLTAASEIAARSLLKKMYETGEVLDLLLTDMIMENEASGIALIKFATDLDPRIMSILFTASESNIDRHSIFEIGTFEIVEKNKVGDSPVGEIINKAKKAILMKQKITQANEMAGFLDKKIAASIMNGDIKDVEICKLVIAFWDIRGFSRLCEIMKPYPRMIAQFLMEYNSLAVEIINKHGGVIDKFIGDGIMAIFGWKSGSSIEDSAYSSIKASIELRGVFESLFEKHRTIWSKEVPDDISIQLGCGINIGDVLFGEFGGNVRRNITAIGSAVNFAARIEGRATEGKILISSTVQAHCGDNIFTTELKSIDDIKNIAGSFKIYVVDGLK